MKYYYFEYLNEDNEEIQIKTESKKSRDTIANYIKAQFYPINNGGYYWEEEEE